MGQRVVAMDVRMAAALAGAVPDVSAFCVEQGISRQSFYKWRRRFAEAGIEGLTERSRRPRHVPGQSPAEVEDQVVRLRKQLADDGADNGPDSIRWALLAQPDRLPVVPSRATIARILTRRGLVIPAPKKRPHSSRNRFVFPRPNDCWQSDWTSWVLADGSPVAIAGTLDDHSRYLGGLRAGRGDGDAGLVWVTMTAAIGECGIPARSLTDNGLVYTGRFINATVAFETNLAALGVQTLNSRPFHPQTCGKIERHWQTLKRWLRARDPASTVTELNAQLEDYRDFYNHRRPHRAHRGRTPGAVFAATAKARPAQHPLPVPLILTTSHVIPNGVAPVGPYDINVGRRWAGHHLDVIRDGEHLTLFSGTRLVRELTIDPTRRYQPGPARYDLRGHREPMTP
jgi:transposase InsO family protein